MPIRNPAGNWDEVLDDYREALAWYESAGNRGDQIIVLSNLAFSLSPQNNPAGNWQEAANTYLKLASVAASAGERDTEAKALSLAAHVACWLPRSSARVSVP